MNNLLVKPQMEEMYSNEVREFLLELVTKELNNIPPAMYNRRKELCEKILEVNRPSGIRTQMREKMKNILVDWNGRSSQIQELESMGFRVCKGKNHYSIHWDSKPYTVRLATTPSDRRGGLNSLSDSNMIFF